MQLPRLAHRRRPGLKRWALPPVCVSQALIYNWARRNEAALPVRLKATLSNFMRP